MKAQTQALARAYAFFREHCGGWVGHNAETAFNLACAERVATDLEWSYAWEYDAEPYECGEGESTPNEVLGCVLRDENGQVLQSLWGIADPSREYARLVEAELASEACHERNTARENDRAALQFQAL